MTMFIPGRAGSTSIYPSDWVTDSLTFPLADEVNFYKQNVSGEFIFHSMVSTVALCIFLSQNDQIRFKIYMQIMHLHQNRQICSL